MNEPSRSNHRARGRNQLARFILPSCTSHHVRRTIGRVGLASSRGSGIGSRAAMFRRLPAAELVLALLFASQCTPAFAQSDGPEITLTVAAGRSLDILLDQRVVIKSVGQP